MARYGRGLIASAAKRGRQLNLPLMVADHNRRSALTHVSIEAAEGYDRHFGRRQCSHGAGGGARDASAAVCTTVTFSHGPQKRCWCARSYRKAGCDWRNLRVAHPPR